MQLFNMKYNKTVVELYDLLIEWRRRDGFIDLQERFELPFYNNLIVHGDCPWHR
jgi:hypothetical protein